MPITRNMRLSILLSVCLFTLGGCAPVGTGQGIAPPGPLPLGVMPGEVGLLTPSSSAAPGQLPPVERAYQFGPEAPNVSAPYRIKAGDVIEVNILGEEDARRDVVVGPDGRISYLSVADLPVAGETFEGVRSQLTEALRMDFIDPRVTITGNKFSGNTVTVVGVVSRPGQYEVREGTKILDILAQAGGVISAAVLGAGIQDFRAVADLKRAVLLRGKTVVPVDFEALLQGNAEDIIANNIAIRSGDTIYVPSGVSIENKVFVLGMVNTPSVVRFTGSISFVEAVAEAGGIPIGAWERRAYVVRGRLSSPTVLPVNVRSVLTGGAPDVPLTAGDIVYIPKTPLSKLDDLASQLIPIIGTIDNTLNVRDRLK